jgi:serine/threonine protein kinase
MGCTSSTAVERVSIHEVYDFQDKLGQGAFGQVRACVHRNTKQDCAVKILNIGGSTIRRAEAKKEGMLWKRVAGHRNVVSLRETYTDSDFSYFVMDKCERSLCDMLLKRPGVQESDLLDTFRQMLLSLEHCHAMQVIHRDVKPANFLVSADGAVKLCDFGLADMDKLEGIVGIIGTAPFMSPEMVRGQSYTVKTDIWSLGATAYMMLYGRYLYKINKEDYADGRRKASEVMHRAIAKNSPPPKFVADDGLPEHSLVARGLVQALLQRDPAFRPSATECLKLSVMAPLRMSASSAETAGSQVSLAPAIKLAKQMTADLKTPVDPTVAKSMDELIAQLQQKFRGSAAFAKSFSLPISGEKSLGLASIDWAPSMSHGGELSIAASQMADDMSDCSTACSSGSRSTRRSL